jgi:hypothetical protein
MAQSAERESIPGGSWSCGRVREHGHEDDGRGDGVDVDGGDLIGGSSTAGKLRRRGKRAFVRIYIYIYVHAGGALVCQQRRLTPRCTRVLRAEECYDAGPAYHQTDPLRSRPLVAQSSNGASASQVQFPDNSLSRPSFSACFAHTNTLAPRPLFDSYLPTSSDDVSPCNPIAALLAYSQRVASERKSCPKCLNRVAVQPFSRV